jgi:hypothetical protein
MGRPATVPGHPFNIVVTLRFNEPELAALDRLRGKESRSAYVRLLIRQAQNEKNRKAKP